MKEGFDVGLEMSGNPKALNSMIDVMFHGGRIASAWEYFLIECSG
jgi:threonine 3-dehydrogenase